MSTGRLANVAEFVFEVDDFDGELRVLRFGGNEAISGLFEFGIQLVSEDPEIDVDSIVGQRATLTIRHDAGERKVYGIISRFEQGSEADNITPYFVELVPEVWLLTQQFGCRIHQQITIPNIIETVLTDAGIPSDLFRIAVNATYPERDYCVQYRESDWNFICRLMEEEGIFYFFEHGDDGCVMVIGDADSTHTPIEADDTVVYRERSGTVAAAEAVYEYRYSQEIRPGTVRYRDYNFETPSLDMEKEVEAPRDDNLVVYDYPGNYLEPDAGEQRATLGLEIVQARRILGLGQSMCRRFIPGYKFTLDEHPQSNFNREYLLTWVRHTGAQPHGGPGRGGHFEYHNEFRCIPSDVPFRPARKTPKPVVEGTQTAIVTGPDGEEIWPDEHGRVKIQFHWDREGQNDENSSCWVRVSQLWAGAGWGAMFIPRIGHEVIVDFLEGDPDQPIIIGRVYHGDNTPPYSLPDDKTKSTIKSDSSLGHDGSNEIRFEDAAGSEEVYIHAQKDMNESIENNMSTTVGGNQTVSVTGDRTKSVDGDETTTVKGDRTETVQDGDEKVTISSGDRTTDINTGDNTRTTHTGDDVINVNTGDSTLNVLTGSRIVNVNTTDDTRNILTGNHTINVNTGNANLNVLTGNRTIAVNTGDYEVTAGAGNIKLEATTNIEATATAEVIVNGLKIGLTGSTEVQISCGGSNIKLEPAKITLSGGGGMIILDPAGVTITGALVKIN